MQTSRENIEISYFCTVIKVSNSVINRNNYCKFNQRVISVDCFNLY